MRAVIETLREHGVEAVEIEEDGVLSVEVPCEDDSGKDCHALLGEIESWLVELGLPFVPEEVNGRILIRPPAG